MADPQTVAPSLLSFAAVGAFVTTVGTLFGHYLKEAVLAKSFESWKKRQALETLYGKYRRAARWKGCALERVSWKGCQVLTLDNSYLFLI